MSENVRVIQWGGGRRRTRVEKPLSHRDQQKRMIRWAPRARALRRKVKHRGAYSRHQEAFSFSFADREAKKKEFPLSKREIACLKALDDLRRRGFGKPMVRDILRAAARLSTGSPKVSRVNLSEIEVGQCLRKLATYNYIIGYGHLQLIHQHFRITNDGKKRLKEEMSTWLDTAF